MFDKKRTLTFAIVMYVMGFGLLILNVINSYSAWHAGATALTIVSVMLILGAVILTVIFARLCKKHKKHDKRAPTTEEALTAEELKQRYDSIQDYGECGFIHHWGAKDTPYATSGKYKLIKDYNGITGYHLALEIRGNVFLTLHIDNKQVSGATPSWLFRLNIGYHDDVALSTNENDNGIILDTDDLQGKTIPFKADDGYMCDVELDECDDIDYGTIEVIKWNEVDHIIAFKCVVESGVNAVFYGTVNLLPDTQD